ncbi:MAG: thrombospondin type 3 repeat-containing protein, partial [Myxococcales bacterium]
DIAIFRAAGRPPWRAVIAANNEDVLLTLRGGKPLYGDAAVLAALGAANCDALDVCGEPRAVCLTSEIGQSFAALSAANASTYPLFFCNRAPADEPTCAPARGAPWLFNGSTAYTGAPSSNDADGDGIPDASDNCPQVFNPVRPMDGGRQGDADRDGVGDACDPCPLQPNTSRCSASTRGDIDADGVPNASDNCLTDPNPDQADADRDGKGDACDACPTDPNPGTAPCPSPRATIYEVKAPGSKWLNKRVALEGVLVTAVNERGFFVQVHESEARYTGRDHSGLYVYYPAAMPRTDVAPGERVTIPDAQVIEFNGQVQLSNLLTGSVFRSSASQPLPAPEIVAPADVATGGTRARALEGVLVQVGPVTVSNPSPAPGSGDPAPTNEFEVAGALRVNDFLFLITPAPRAGEAFTSLTGVLQFHRGNYKLEPRNASDVVRAPTLPALASLGPTPAFAR